MSRSIDLQDDGVHVRYSGLDSALALKRELHLPYHAIEEVGVGLDEAPSTWTLRRAGTADPFTGTRRGHFWVAGKRYFLDFRHPERAVVVRLKPGYDVAVVAIETDHPESLVAAIRDRTG